SATSTVWWRRRRPRPFTDEMIAFSSPKVLFTWVTRMVLLAMALSQDLFHALAALGRDLIGRTHGRERIDGGTHDVDRVARAVALGEHVAHADALQHRAHRAAGDDARTVGGRLHQHAGGTVGAAHGVVQRVLLQAHVDQVLAGVGHGLGDRHRHFARLAEPEANAAAAVAHDGQRGEAELAATLHDLRGAV